MPLDSDHLTEIRRLLELRRQNLLAEAEEASKKQEKAKGSRKKTRKAKDPIESAVSHELAEVDSALKRLETQGNRFGYCDRCFMEIPWGEIVSNPARRFCGRCT